MKKIKVKGLKKEMSTTGTGASFTPGTGAQYATPKSFKKNIRRESTMIVGDDLKKYKEKVDLFVKAKNPRQEIEALKQLDQLYAQLDIKDISINDYEEITSDNQLSLYKSSDLDESSRSERNTNYIIAMKMYKNAKGTSDEKKAVDNLKKASAAIGLKLPAFDDLDEIGEPFTTPNPSIPNRKSKFMDYKQLFEKLTTELKKKKPKWNPVTDFTDSQAWAGDNTGYDMDTQDAASVLELAKTSKDGKIKVGDVAVEKGTRYVVTDVDPVTGGISWDVEAVPAFDSVYKEFDELRKAIATLDRKTDDEVVDDIATKIKAEFNRYRTHIRKNYPEEYKRFQTNENIDEASGGVSRSILIKLVHDLGAQRFADIITDLRDENLQDQIVAAFGMYTDEEGSEFIKPDILREARYSQFKTETKLRTPTEQIHRAVREIRRKIDEIVKVVGHTERMKSELKQSNEGMSYLKRTRNAINTISEKLQELNNRIKGLTE